MSPGNFPFAFCMLAFLDNEVSFLDNEEKRTWLLKYLMCVLYKQFTHFFQVFPLILSQIHIDQQFWLES